MNNQDNKIKKFKDDMHDVSGAVMVFGEVIISAFFVLVILILILVVDIQRVGHGIQLFESSDKLALGGAFVMVMLLMTLEFVSHFVESKYDYHKQQKTHFSFKSLRNWWLYVKGDTDNWQPRRKSPALHIRKYARLLKITILILALMGSMADEIVILEGNWIEGLIEIGTQSSLLEMAQYGSSLLYTYALVLGAELLTGYVAQRASETLSDNPQHVDTINIQEPSENHEKPHYVDSTINISDHHLLQLNEAPVMIATCEECGWNSTPKTNETSVKKSLLMHQKHCDKCQEKQVQS